MGAKDYLALFRFSILKVGLTLVLLIIWFGLLFFLPKIGENLPPGLLETLSDFQQAIPNKESWLIPFNIIVLTAWMLTFVLLKELTTRFIDFTKRGTFYTLTAQSWNMDWIYNGKTKFLSETSLLRVNSSRAGCLLKKHLWKNFKMNFQFRFLNKGIADPYYEYIGLIFRARDLENYLMLEMIQNNSEFLIKPHVRYLGMWETMSEERISCNAKTSTDWREVHLVVNGREAKLSVVDFGEYTWFLPTHVDINHIEDGPRKNNSAGFGEKEFAIKTNLLPEIEFKESFGMIGFRAHLNQGAEIKDLTIQTIAGNS